MPRRLRNRLIVALLTAVVILIATPFILWQLILWNFPESRTAGKHPSTPTAFFSALNVPAATTVKEMTAPVGDQWWIIAEPYGMSNSWLAKNTNVDPYWHEALGWESAAVENVMIVTLRNGGVVSVEYLDSKFDVVHGGPFVVRPGDHIKIQHRDGKHARPLLIDFPSP